MIQSIFKGYNVTVLAYMSSILDLYLCNCNNSQVILGTDKAFTYDSAYSPETPQIEAYTKSVSPTFQSLLKGYNVTVLAYGPTGSGKTHTMGTSHSKKKTPNNKRPYVKYEDLDLPDDGDDGDDPNWKYTPLENAKLKKAKRSGGGCQCKIGICLNEMK
ncbi:Chromosome-associated kinesin KIF4B [Nymphon striatum]|nr:Chromosome-associated kinesin KIF4B [Nymphon striatum]